MTEKQAALLVGALKAAFPRAEWDSTTVQLYVQSIGDLDFDEAEPAVRDLIFTSTFPPTIAEIRRRYADRVLGLPSAVVAWELVLGAHAAEDRPEPVQRALAAVGGSYAVKTTERPDVLRAQFMSYYGSYAEQARLAIITPGLSVLPEPKPELAAGIPSFEPHAIE